MSVNHNEARSLLRDRYVLFSCEGKAECVIIERLVEDDCLVVAKDHVVKDPNGRPFTTIRKAKRLEQTSFIGPNYEGGLLIARIVDVNPGAFRLSKLVAQTTKVLDFVTRPEIEALVLVRENAWDAFEKRSKSERKLNASDWCIQHLKMGDVKDEGFLKEYWHDSEVLCRTIRSYNSLLGGHKNDQLGLIDVLKA